MIEIYKMHLLSPKNIQFQGMLSDTIVSAFSLLLKFPCLHTRMSYFGVIEGFYGRPWKQSQRIELLKRMNEWNLNAFQYSPKVLGHFLAANQLSIEYAKG